MGQSIQIYSKRVTTKMYVSIIAMHNNIIMRIWDSTRVLCQQFLESQEAYLLALVMSQSSPGMQTTYCSN